MKPANLLGPGRTRPALPRARVHSSLEDYAVVVLPPQPATVLQPSLVVHL